jgi:hypothetical protein
MTLNGYWYRPPPKPDQKLYKYASEMMHALGNRRHALGVLIMGFNIIFHVYDRGGRIRTTPLSLRDDGPRIVEAFVRIMMLDPYQLGLEPFLYPSPRVTSSKLSTTSGCVVKVGGCAFLVERLIHSTSQGFGRGSVVFQARTIKKHCTPLTSNTSTQSEGVDHIPEQVVLKLAWQLRNRRDEVELLKLAAEKGVKGVAEIYRSCVVTTLSQGLRRRLGCEEEYMYVDRELRVQVLGPICKPLEEVEDIGQLKQAFRSLVKSKLPSNLVSP